MSLDAFTHYSDAERASFWGTHKMKYPVASLAFHAAFNACTICLGPHRGPERNELQTTRPSFLVLKHETEVRRSSEEQTQVGRGSEAQCAT
eukprot:1738004-Amphidinium_carterae.1